MRIALFACILTILAGCSVRNRPVPRVALRDIKDDRGVDATILENLTILQDGATYLLTLAKHGPPGAAEWTMALTTHSRISRFGPVERVVMQADGTETVIGDYPIESSVVDVGTPNQTIYKEVIGGSVSHETVATMASGANVELVFASTRVLLSSECKTWIRDFLARCDGGTPISGLR